MKNQNARKNAGWTLRRDRGAQKLLGILAMLGGLFVFPGMAPCDEQALMANPTPVMELRFTQPHDWQNIPNADMLPVLGTIWAEAPKYDFLFVMDCSGSLGSTDPNNYRSSGAIELVRALPVDFDIRMGVVAFSNQGNLRQPLTGNRDMVVSALGKLEQSGGTNIEGGLTVALDELLKQGRPEAVQFILLFSDGEENVGNARNAANLSTVPIHSFFLGYNQAGERLLKDIATITDAQYVHIKVPEDIPYAFREVVNLVRDLRVALRSSVAPDWVTTVTIAHNQWQCPEVPIRPGPDRITTILATLYPAIYSHDTPRFSVTEMVRVIIQRPCFAVAESLKNLSESAWEPNPELPGLGRIRLQDTAAGLRLEPDGPPGKWYYGFYQTRDFHCALPEVPHILRLEFDPHREGVAFLPDPRIRVFRANNSVSYFCLTTEVTGRSMPRVLEIPFLSDGSSPFRIAADLLALDDRMLGGWSLRAMNIYAPGGFDMKTSIVSAAKSTFMGEYSNDVSAYSIAFVGDVNGDGFDDILIGAPESDFSGANAGQSYLVFGRAHGPILWSGLETANASFVGEFPGDRSGAWVAAAGDVNNDGYADFLVGAPGNSQAGEQAGKTYLVLGRREGWAMRSSLAQADVMFTGEAAMDRSGHCVAPAGDINNDGYADFLIGAPQNGFAGAKAGQVYLILGRAEFPEKTMSLETADSSFCGEGADQLAGHALASAGDVNGDGFDDFLIGAPGNSDAGGPYAGKAYLLLGKQTGWGRRFPLSAANASFTGEAAGDWAGTSLAGVGDVNRDGYADFMVGAHNTSQSAHRAGKAYLLLGKPSGWTRNACLSLANASFLGEKAGDSAGFRVAGAGDVNGDGFDDLLISAIGSDIPALDAGCVYLVFGKASGWKSNEPLASVSTVLRGESGPDACGYSLAGGGDFNGDGWADFLVGAVRNRIGGAESGHTYLLQGGRDEFSISVSHAGTGRAVAATHPDLQRVLNDLTDASWESVCQILPYERVELADVPQGLSFTIPHAPSRGFYGFYQTRAFLAALPAGLHILRVHLHPMRPTDRLLPDIRVRVFHADNSKSFFALRTEKTGVTMPPWFDVPFISDGVSEFRIAFDLLALDTKMAGGWIVRQLEIDP
jgi:hypothetical protein